MRGHSVSKIFTSPEPKAKITADAVSKKYRIPVVISPEVAEVDRSKAGYIEGNYISIVESYLSESEEFKYCWEDINNVRKRIKRFVDELKKEEGNVLVVSHGMCLSIMLAECFSKNIIDFWKSLRFGHVLEIDYEILKKNWENST